MKLPAQEAKSRTEPCSPASPSEAGRAGAWIKKIK